jgi:single-strand DNA-binding protein
VDRPFTNQAGVRETDFVDCVAWRKLGETVGNHLTKGRLTAVEGRLQIRSYETQDGSKRRVAEVIADSMEFLDRPRDGAGKDAPMPTDASADDSDVSPLPLPNDDDVPF